MENNIEDLFSDDIENDSLLNFEERFGFTIEALEKEMVDYQPKMDIKYSRSNEDAVTPQYAYPTDSGFDLHSTEDVWIHPFDRKLVPTGLHVDIPDGYEVQVRSKSGLALKQGLMVLNSPGTVDQGYTGEIKVIVFNTTNQKVKIDKWQKIAQAVVCPVVSGKWIKLIEVDNIEDKDRSDKGFGSTGI
jgi:dUTP pyrophosphatase